MVEVLCAEGQNKGLVFRSFLDPVVAHLETKERWTGNWWDNWIDYLNVDSGLLQEFC